MAKQTSVTVYIRRWANSKDEVLENLITECLPKHYGWEAAQKAYYYAQRILKKRWPEGEKVILKHSPHFAYLYAKNIINGRWIEAEPFISTETHSSYYYSKFVLKQRFPEYEKNLLEAGGKLKGYVNHEKMVDYAKFFLKDRLPKRYEKQICERGHLAAKYAVNVLKKRWKAAEKNIIKANKQDIDLYIRSLKSVKDRREFRTLLLADSMSKSSYGWCPAKTWIEENENSLDPVSFV